MDGKQIYANFTQAEAKALMIALQEVARLNAEFTQEAEDLKSARDEMLKYWQGDAAEAAGKGLDPLVEAHAESAPLLDKTVESLSEQINMFYDAKHRVVPVPDLPPAPAPYPSGFEVLNPVAVGTAIGEHRAYSSKLADHEAANENNIRVMDQYASGTNSTSDSLPADYGVLKDDGSEMSISDSKIRSGEQPGSNVPNVGGTSASSASGYGGSGGVGGGYGGSPSVGGTGGPGGGGGPIGPGAQTGVGNVGTGPGGGATTNPGAPIGRPGGGAPIIGGPMGGPVGGGGDQTRKGPFSGGVRPGARPIGGGSAGARLTGGGAGSAGGAGAPKSGAVPGSGTAKPGGAGGALGAGKGAGVGGPGGGAAAAANAAKAGGAGARGGMGGMAGGAGAGRGQGGEDKEHTRASFLQENDPESLFGSDELTAPPVIGDPSFDPDADPRAGK